MKYGVLFLLPFILFSCCSVPDEKWAMFTGYKIAVSGDLAVIGTGYGDAPGGYITVVSKQRDTWQCVETFNLRTLAKGYRGPVSLSVNNKNIAVGLDGKKGRSGAVLVLQKVHGSWIPSKPFTAPDKESNDLFGNSVSVSDNMLAIGASGKKQYRGCVYLYSLDKEPFRLLQSLTDDEQIPITLFGESVALERDSLIIGSPGYFYEANKTLKNKKSIGKVVIFNCVDGTWIYGSRLYDLKFYNTINLELGTNLFIDNGKLCISDDINVYFVTKDADNVWKEENSIKFDAHLITTAYSNDILIATYAFGNSTLDTSYYVYIFRKIRGAWINTDIIKPSDLNEKHDYFFGNEIAVSGNTLLISALGNDPSAIDAANVQKGPGHVYIIKLLPEKGYEVEAVISRKYDENGNVSFTSRIK